MYAFSLTNKASHRTAITQHVCNENYEIERRPLHWKMETHHCSFGGLFDCTEEDKVIYQENGVVCNEMECTAVAEQCHLLGVNFLLSVQDLDLLSVYTFLLEQRWALAQVVRKKEFRVHIKLFDNCFIV